MNIKNMTKEDLHIIERGLDFLIDYDSNSVEYENKIKELIEKIKINTEE